MKKTVYRTYEEYRVERPQNEGWAARVKSAMLPYERDRLRDGDEARLLRERGTPESLIGPTTAL